MMHRIAVAGLAAALAPLALAQGSQDSIWRTGNDKPIKAKITQETLGDLKYSISGGVTSNVPWEQVTRVVYGEGDGPFASAETAIAKGDFAGAQKTLEGLTTPRDIFVPRRLFLLGKALQGAQKPKDAEAKYAEVVDKHADSRWVKFALKALVDLQKQEKNYAGAVDTADKGIKIAQGAKLESAALEFRLEKASVLEAQDDKIDAAIAEYAKVASDAASSAPKVSQTAKALQARAMARKGKDANTAQAKALVEDVLKSDDSALLTLAHAAMGEALLVEGVKESSADKLKDAAILHLLRVDVQYPPAASESQEPLEYALYGFVRASSTLMGLAKANKDDAEYWKAQTTAHGRDFLERFPNSRYAKQVKDLMPR